MSPLRRTRHLALTVASVVVITATVAGCGEEPIVRDATNSTSVISGAEQRLADTDVELIDADSPYSASVPQTQAALTAGGLTATSVEPDSYPPLADDVANAGGLVAALAPPAGAFTGTPFVVLVFETPTPAILFADAGPQVFTDRGSEVSGVLSGNLLVYAATPGLVERLAELVRGGDDG